MYIHHYNPVVMICIIYWYHIIVFYYNYISIVLHHVLFMTCCSQFQTISITIVIAISPIKSRAVHNYKHYTNIVTHSVTHSLEVYTVCTVREIWAIIPAPTSKASNLCTIRNIPGISTTPHSKQYLFFNPKNEDIIHTFERIEKLVCFLF